MSATTIPTRQGSLARTASDITVITRRNLLYTVRLPDVLVLSASMPVIFILLFTYVFGGAIQGALPPAAAGSYVNWLIPGPARPVRAVRRLGDRVRPGRGSHQRGHRPVPRAADDPLGGARRSHPVGPCPFGGDPDAHAGRRVRDRIPPADRLHGPARRPGGRPGLRLRVVVADGAAGAGGAHRRGGPGGGVHGGVPLAFTSSVFVPTPTMPAWLQPFAANQPVTVATNALRGLVLGPGALPPGRTVAGQVVLALVWAAAITAVFAPWPSAATAAPSANPHHPSR